MRIQPVAEGHRCDLAVFAEHNASLWQIEVEGLAKPTVTRLLDLARGGQTLLTRGAFDLARQAETLGFSHGWTFDSHMLWQEPFVIFSQMLASTKNMVVGPMVTNPATRDITVLASLFATLNEMYGDRTICGIGRGDLCSG